MVNVNQVLVPFPALFCDLLRNDSSHDNSGPAAILPIRLTAVIDEAID